MMAPYSDQNEHSSLLEQQRLPMRKPMSMVEYWVQTGTLPQYEYGQTNKSSSGSESSLTEEELYTVQQTFNLSKPPINSSLEKNCDNSALHNKNHNESINTTNSTVDTRVYILANNNTTTKSETAAIIEDSKFFQKDTFPNTPTKSVFDQNTLTINLSTATTIENQFNKNTTDIDDHKKGKKQNKGKVNNIILPSLSSKSDESLYRSKFIEDSQNLTPQKKMDAQQLKKNLLISHSSSRTSKESKRKRLYNSQCSTVEFTPVSDENFSFKMTKHKSENCEHPALQTPKTVEKFSSKKKSIYSRKSSRKPFLHSSPLKFKLIDENKTLPPKDMDNLVEDSKNFAKQSVSILTFEKEYENYLKNYEKSEDKVSKVNLENKPKLFNSSFDSYHDKHYMTPLSSNLEKLYRTNEYESEIPNSSFEKKNESNKSTHLQKLNRTESKFLIVFSDDDEDFNDKTMIPSEQLDKNLDKSLEKSKITINKASKANNSQKKKAIEITKSKTRKREKVNSNESKTFNKLNNGHKQFSPSSIKEIEREYYSEEEKSPNKKAKLVKSDDNVLTCSHESKKTLIKKPLEKKNFKKWSESIQTMNNKHKYAIIFSSSDESE